MKLIINADDYGMTKAINESIEFNLKRGTLTSTTVMVNMPYAEDAIGLLNIEGISVGLHFNLTQGIPITKPELIPSLVGKNGVFLNKKELELRAKKGKINQEEVVQELDAQWQKLASIIGKQHISHMDSHQGLNRIPVIYKALKQFGTQNKVKALRVYVKHYCQPDGSIVKPSILSIPKFGLKRYLVEFYLKQNRKELGKNYSFTEGMLVSNSHESLDVFKWMLNHSAKLKNYEYTLEIPCHPASGTEELGETKLTASRLEEHQVLSSDEFLNALSNVQMINYHQI